MPQRSLVGGEVGAVIGVIAAAALVAAYDSTATTVEELAGRGTFVAGVAAGALAGAIAGTLLADAFGR